MEVVVRWLVSNRLMRLPFLRFEWMRLCSRLWARSSRFRGALISIIGWFLRRFVCLCSLVGMIR